MIGMYHQSLSTALIGHKNTLGSEDLLDASPGTAIAFVSTWSDHSPAKMMGQNGNPPSHRSGKRQKGLGDIRILLVPREMIHNADKDLQVWKLCLESMGEGSEKEGRKEGSQILPGAQQAHPQFNEGEGYTH